ncbi:MAG: hypothetical protein KME02_11390 [Aphanothece saxicola GSE-SYN-MK-01-06B]|nr:hypothetical protein [Aphanothece saxicola GSE-SYN-MK-01-06B]
MASAIIKIPVASCFGGRGGGWRQERCQEKQSDRSGPGLPDDDQTTPERHHHRREESGDSFHCRVVLCGDIYNLIRSHTATQADIQHVEQLPSPLVLIGKKSPFIARCESQLLPLKKGLIAPVSIYCLQQIQSLLQQPCIADFIG